MGKLMDKVLGFMGVEVKEAEDFEEESQSWSDGSVKPNRNNVVALHNSRPIKMIVVKPVVFEQVQVISDHLKARRPVIINLEGTEKDIAKRILDFVSGTAYALNGSMQKISQYIFLFVPTNVEVSGEMAEEARSYGAFHWESLTRP
ncbi:MAG: cell division protein SepF [Syntrophomonadaceae bacterium]|jgi:cell division inhibitor SepF|nr:cell division protein SepF [Syntrophomonadaceae bacterium]